MASRPFIEAEIRWFYETSDGALGLKGVNLSPGGGEPRDHGLTTSQRHTDCLRWSRVASALRQLPPGGERVLSLAYTPHHWPGLERWYERAGVAALIVARERARNAEEATPRAVLALRVLEAEVRAALANVSLIGGVAELSQSLHLRVPEFEVEIQKDLDQACDVLAGLHEQLVAARGRVDRLHQRGLESVVDAGRLIPRMQDEARKKLEEAASVLHRQTLDAFRAAYQGATT